MSLKSEVICKICKRFLKNPISLPCFCVICDEHLHDGSAKHGLIECSKCSRSFDISQTEFKTSEMAASILAKDLHLTDEEKSLKNSFQDALQQIDQLQDELKSKQSVCEVTCFDHFSEIRRQIDIRREALKAKIDEIALEMIDLTNEKEKSYHLKLSELLIDMIEINTPAETEVFRHPDLVISEVRQQLVKNLRHITKLKSKIANLDMYDTNVRANEFKVGREFQNESFGSLRRVDQKLISCSESGIIKVTDLETNVCMVTLPGHRQTVMCLEIIDERKFASCSDDTTVNIWDAINFVCLQTIKGHQSSVICLKSITQKALLASGSYGEIKIWDLDKYKFVRTLKGHSNWIREIICLSENTLASCSSDKTVRMWDLAQGVCSRTFVYTSEINCLLLTKSGLLTSGSSDYTIQIWDMGSGECVKTLRGHGSFVRRLQSLESGELVSCSGDGTSKVWDLNSATCIRTLVGHTQIVKAIKVSRNGQLISGSCDGTIKKWNTETGKCLQTYLVHAGAPIRDLLII